MKKDGFDVLKYLWWLLQNGNESERAIAFAMLKRYEFVDALEGAEKFLPNGRKGDNADSNAPQKNKVSHNWQKRVDVLTEYRDQLAARKIRLSTLGLNRRGHSYKAIEMEMSEAIHAWNEWLFERDKYADRNLGLVHKAAGRYSNLAQRLRCEYADLVAAGYAGILIALDNFDVALGFALSTYAIPWINREIQDELRKQALIRIPRDQADNLCAMFDEENDFFAKNGRYPTVDELEERFTRKDEYRTAALNATAIKSLDAPRENPEGDDDCRLVDLVKAAPQCQPEETCIQAEMKGLINKAIGALNGREQLSLAIKYEIPFDADFLNLEAFFEEQEQIRPGFRERADEITREPGNITYDDLGELLGVSRQRSEQIVKTAIQKLWDDLGGMGDK